MPTKPYTLSLLYLCGLIIQAGYIHTNPGPTSDPCPKYPCGTCSHEVHDHHHAIQCDQCDIWYHTACVQINDTTYGQLKYHSVLWFCSCCGLPNYSEYLFTSNINTPNPYSVLESTPNSSDYTNISDDANPTFAPNPANTSTPDRAKITSKPKLKFHADKLVLTRRIMSGFVKFIVACRRDTLLVLLMLNAVYQLNSSIPTYSVLPTNYEAIHKYRNIHGWRCFYSTPK